MSWNFADLFEAKEFAYTGVLTFLIFLILGGWTNIIHILWVIGIIHIGGFIIRNLLNM